MVTIIETYEANTRMMKQNSEMLQEIFRQVKLLLTHLGMVDEDEISGDREVGAKQDEPNNKIYYVFDEMPTLDENSIEDDIYPLSGVEMHGQRDEETNEARHAVSKIEVQLQLRSKLSDIVNNEDVLFNLYKGILQEPQRTKLVELLLYYSTKNGDEMTSLKDYVTRMKESWSDIYYITGESEKSVENSLFLENLKKKGYEVLYTINVIEKNAARQLKGFEGKKFGSATKKD
ncbi:hypothetical protein V6N11_075971 [Hibiscus sabdariffa]|uniref:Uncharacterized protein n=1 Tax=Hibiscus sabdariffa TaxID=183260 RepID=A0ABR2Q4W1_9ROSI